MEKVDAHEIHASLFGKPLKLFYALHFALLIFIEFKIYYKYNCLYTGLDAR